MSSITPQSFVDDGGSFTKRVPRGLDQRQVASWIASSKSDTSAYTGSFIDDGADMHLPRGAAPGFGPIDKRFYKQKKRKESKDGAGTVWNDDVQKAISGDVQRNLDKIRGLGGLEVKPTDPNGRQDEDSAKQEKAKDTVTIPMPPQWGTFVIKADDGRVIIVDKDGEFDSGPQKPVSEQPKHWIKAASTVEAASPIKDSILRCTPTHRTSSGRAKEHSREAEKQKSGREKRNKTNKSRRSHLSPPKTLRPIPESEYEKATSVASPAVSVRDTYDHIVPESPIKAISEGFRYVRPRSWGHKDIVAAPNSWIEEKRASPVRWSSGGWQSPGLSPAKGDSKVEAPWDGGQFESAWNVPSPSHSHKSQRSCHTSRSNKSRKSKKDSEKASVKSHATYKAPTVEDATSTPSDGEDYIATGWGGSVKSSGTQDWGGDKNTKEKSLNSKRGDRESARASPTNVPHPHTWADAGSKSLSERSWSKGPQATDNPSWAGVEPCAFHGTANSPKSLHFGSPTHPPSDATWDGFERIKSASEVGVVDTGSERASVGRQSRVSSLHSARQSHGSHDARASHKSSGQIHAAGWEDGQAGWAGGSQTSHLSRHSRRPDDTAIWPGSRAVSEQSWDSQKARVDDGNDDQWGGTGEDVKGVRDVSQR